MIELAILGVLMCLPFGVGFFLGMWSGRQLAPPTPPDHGQALEALRRLNREP